MSNNKIQVIDSKEIDLIKWRDLLLRSPAAYAQYCEHWFISSISDSWEVYVLGDYLAAFPCVYKIKYGVKVMYQPFFSREFTFLGAYNVDFVNETLHRIAINYKLIQFNSSLMIKGIDFKITKNSYQVLDLSSDYNEIYKCYSTNTKRILKKNGDIDITESENLNDFIDLFKKNIGIKLGYNIYNYNCLHTLIDEGMKNGTIKLFSFKNGNDQLGYACFYFYGNVINYIKGVLTDNGKQDGAMYRMFDQIIKVYSGKDNNFDFGGSNIEGVATFYRKFGSKDQSYYTYEKNQLPFLARKIYELRQKFIS